MGRCAVRLHTPMNTPGVINGKWTESSSAWHSSRGDTDTMFKLLFERTADPILLFDPRQGVFIDCNQAAVDLLRASDKQRLLQVRPEDLAPPFQSDGLPTAEKSKEITQLAKAQGGYRFEWLARAFDGRDIPLEVVVTAVSMGTESIHVVIARDITERKKAEHALLESQRLLASVSDNISEAIYRSGPDHKLYFVNCAYLGMFRYRSLAEIQSIPREKLYADVQVRQQLLGRLARDGAFSNQEVEFVRKDGSRFWGLASSRAIREPGTSKLLYHVGAITDISEHKRDEAEIVRLNQSLERRIEERTAELTASEARLRTLIDHAPEAIVVFDGDSGQFLFGNAHACRIFGCQPEDLPRLSPIVVSPESQPDGTPSWLASRKYVQQALAGSIPVFEWSHRHSSGRIIPTEVRLVRLPGPGRNLIRASIIDNTERKKAEAELLKALAREKELGTLKSNFVSMVSHEFRTPLGVIISSAEILDSYFDRLDPNERREQLQSIQKNIRRMAAMMEEVLLVGMVEAGRLDYQPAPLDLVAFGRRIVTEVLSAIDRHREIRFVPGPLPADVSADERLLNHIFTNLLSNALKYSAPDAEIEWTIHREGTDAVWRVSDRGLGIPESDVAHLFSAFHRGHNVSHLPGTGLGLAIVKRCVDLHHGSIAVESRVGHGTTVTVRLPIFPSL